MAFNIETVEIEFSYSDYKTMSQQDRENVYKMLYCYFNNTALKFDLSQEEVFALIMAKAITDETYEFAEVLRDFSSYFPGDFE